MYVCSRSSYYIARENSFTRERRSFFYCRNDAYSISNGVLQRRVTLTNYLQINGCAFMRLILYFCAANYHPCNNCKRIALWGAEKNNTKVETNWEFINNFFAARDGNFEKILEILCKKIEGRRVWHTSGRGWKDFFLLPNFRTLPLVELNFQNSCLS